jgi:predicted Ser/Thr protein kinase
MAVRARGRTLVLSDGRYRTEGILGHGGMATVFLGVDESLERPVAIKLLADNLASDEDFHNRFLLEARLAGKLGHPNIVQIFDVAEFEGRPFIVMEYVPGETLAELLARRKTLDEEEAIELALQACAGLEHAHRAKLVHRDVKPHNLLVREDGTLKIVDFGIARAAEDKGLTQTGTILGTRPYLSPERERGDDAGPQADVYALGVVISEMVGGEAGPGLVKIVSRCLEPDPDRRYDSAIGLRRALAGLTGERMGRPAIAGLVRGAPTAEPTDAAQEAKTSRLSPTDVRGHRDGAPVKAGAEPERIEIRHPAGTPPAIRARRPGWRSSTLVRVAALGAALLLLAGAAFAAFADRGGDSGRAEAGSTASPRTAPPDFSGAPADDARALADWLRGHARR